MWSIPSSPNRWRPRYRCCPVDAIVWPTEVAYEEGKELAGVGQARNRTEKAVQRTVPFQFICMSLTICRTRSALAGLSYTRHLTPDDATMGGAI